MNLFKGVCALWVELEFGSVDFCGERKTRKPGEKPSEQGSEPTTNSTHIIVSTLGIEPRPHWWEVKVNVLLTL